jgi:hypothetical protein
MFQPQPLAATNLVTVTLWAVKFVITLNLA